MENHLLSTLEACRSVMIDCKIIIEKNKRNSAIKENLSKCLQVSKMATTALLINSPKAAFYCSLCAEYCKIVLINLKNEYREDFQNCINACSVLGQKQYIALA